jgi:hypothetical protein
LSKEPSLLLLLKFHVFEVTALIILAATEATSHHLSRFGLPVLRVKNYLQIGISLKMLDDCLNELLMSALNSYPEYCIASMVSLIDVKALSAIEHDQVLQSLPRTSLGYGMKEGLAMNVLQGWRKLARGRWGQNLLKGWKGVEPINLMPLILFDVQVPQGCALLEIKCREICSLLHQSLEKLRIVSSVSEIACQM